MTIFKLRMAIYFFRRERTRGSSVMGTKSPGLRRLDQQIDPNENEGPPSTWAKDGVFVFLDRDELYRRINRRVEKMFAQHVIEEVRALRSVSATAEKAIGLREIRELLDGNISEKECILRIQQGTRHYAKRQLTWFQQQTNFEPLNLSSYGTPEATELIAQKARSAFAQMND